MCDMSSTDDDQDDANNSDDDEDDEAELLRELQKIKQERAAEAARKVSFNSYFDFFS